MMESAGMIFHSQLNGKLLKNKNVPKHQPEINVVMVPDLSTFKAPFASVSTLFLDRFSTFSLETLPPSSAAFG